MKNIIYTDHLVFRLKVREIDENLPKQIYIESKVHYRDKATGNFVATEEVTYMGRKREMAVVYKETENFVEMITIHPLKKSQTENRINTGRWEKIEK